MGIGWIVSLIVGGIMMVVIIVIAISLERKYIVRENGKINYKKTTIFLRWNVFDTLTIVLSIYTILCVQSLNMLVSSGQTVENPYVQFFTNQSQVWVTVDILYLVFRVSNTMKSIKAHWGDELDDEQ
ncbi:group-specific protein [Lysinibacillus pakistanensis]|uniref:Group-specific protein n=1 Tax=Lysinibacillus pakistanensis TaxID=759811 RepID=A0AAX3WSU5_9BACI|nr:group-specific protein [Lysinibacillus pakistanensis]MDM5234084.1 group-specific protein [Lysinibacillus pakistanensis]WHY44685.1 group-specific protein [Lysinibacillus pakistanensis]WHY49691.1 group-specific protein [Lysinibacillus pakistanensis]